MGMHSYNYGLKTSGKGEIFESFSVAIGAAGAVGTITQAGANLVQKVELSSTATYTVTLNAPLPPTLVACNPRVSCAAANSATVLARYKSGSYDATAGTFVIFCTDSAGTTPTAPASGDSISVFLTFEQYKNMPT